MEAPPVSRTGWGGNGVFEVPTRVVTPISYLGKPEIEALIKSGALNFGKYGNAELELKERVPVTPSLTHWVEVMGFISSLEAGEVMRASMNFSEAETETIERWEIPKAAGKFVKVSFHFLLAPGGSFETLNWTGVKEAAYVWRQIA